MSYSQPVRNYLLAALPAGHLESLRPHLEHVPLEARQVLQEFETPMRHAYFIERGAASLLAKTRQDGPMEVAIIGRMGIVGLPIVLGTMRSPHRCIVQVPGEAWRIKADDFRGAMAQSPALRQVLFNYVQAAMVQGSQLIICNTGHPLHQRLARWVLMIRDRIEDDDIPLTHDLLGKMLGAPEAGVREAVGKLEAAGMIRDEGGLVTILDRAGLEQLTCECYRIMKAEYDRLVPEPDVMPRMA